MEQATVIAEFRLKGAMSNQTQAVCDSFNKEVGDGYVIYPHAELGMGIAGDQTILITERLNQIEGVEGEYNFDGIEDAVQRAAQKHGFTAQRRFVR